MPVRCTFLLNNQPMSTLICPGFGSMAAFSGKPSYVDNPAATAVQDAGPSPKGHLLHCESSKWGAVGVAVGLA